MQCQQRKSLDDMLHALVSTYLPCSEPSWFCPAAGAHMLQTGRLTAHGAGQRLGAPHGAGQRLGLPCCYLLWALTACAGKPGTPNPLPPSLHHTTQLIVTGRMTTQCSTTHKACQMVWWLMHASCGCILMAVGGIHWPLSRCVTTIVHSPGQCGNIEHEIGSGCKAFML